MKRRAGAFLMFPIMTMGLGSADALATENGLTHANLGYLDLFAGFEPPPGFYFRNDVIGVTSSSLNDRNGDRARLGGVLPVNFHSDALIDIATFYYVSPVQFAGGNFATAVLVPSKNQNVSLGTALTGTTNTSVTGLGDVIVVPQLGWHLTQWNLHITIGPAFYTPTGQYRVTDPLGNNVGHNFLTVEPQVNVTYLNKTGQEVSLVFAYDFNSTNSATTYRSGQEFSINYAVAQHFSESWTVVSPAITTVRSPTTCATAMSSSASPISWRDTPISSTTAPAIVARCYPSARSLNTISTTGRSFY